MTKRIASVLVGIFTLFVAPHLAFSQIDRKTKDDLYSQIELFSYALTTVESEYAEKPNPKDLIYGALKGMLASLDPHSQFLEPEAYQELKSETQGKFGGLGIEISIRDGLLTVISPIEDTPAWKAGIKAGDRIVKIEDKLTKDMTLNDAVKILRGKPGTKVKITVLREKEFKLLDFTITRKIIRIHDIKNPIVLRDHVAYVRIAEFREDTPRDLHAAIKKLMDEGADSLILDLRNNPGGLLFSAIKISEEFLPAGKIIVSTRGRQESQNTVTYSKNNNPAFKDLPLIVLINEGSASGSEILAGALKDNNRAVIVGTTSFGKGSVQSVIPLPDGSGLRLTTSKYFTPSGKSIHGIGITPDVVVERIYIEPTEDNGEQKVEKIFENIEAKEKKGKEGKEELAKKKEEELRKTLLQDNQITAALDIMEGIKVYGKMVKQGM